jgi:hypothetical protein
VSRGKVWRELVSRRCCFLTLHNLANANAQVAKRTAGSIPGRRVHAQFRPMARPGRSEVNPDLPTLLTGEPAPQVLHCFGKGGRTRSVLQHVRQGGGRGSSVWDGAKDHS